MMLMHHDLKKKQRKHYLQYTLLLLSDYLAPGESL